MERGADLGLGRHAAGERARAGRGTRPCRRRRARGRSRAPSGRGARRPGALDGCVPTRAAARPRRGSRARGRGARRARHPRRSRASSPCCRCGSALGERAWRSPCTGRAARSSSSSDRSSRRPPPSSATHVAWVSSGGVVTPVARVDERRQLLRCRRSTAAVRRVSTRASTRSQFSWKPIATRRNVLCSPNSSKSHSCTSSTPPSSAPPSGMRVLEQTLEQVLPALLEGEVALQLVEHAEARRQPGRHGELVEQAPGEGVQRADRSVIELVERGLEAIVRRVVVRPASAAGALERRPAAGGAGRRRPSR